MHYFDHLERRVPFPVMQEHCTRNLLPTAQGWEKLKVKLEDECASSGERKAEIEEALERIYLETLSVGSRAARAFKIEDESFQDVLHALSSLQPEPSLFLDRFPSPLTAQELAVTSSRLVLCEVYVSPDEQSVRLIFCGKRMIEEREPRTRTQIGDAAINQFGWQQYDEFVLIRREYVQSYEVVRFDVNSGRLELHVENKVGSDLTSSLQALQECISERLLQLDAITSPLINPLNLFPAISSIYNDNDNDNDNNEGIVVELGFTTETGSAKHEKMRSNRADLRTELFHVGGKAAVNGILTPFRVAVRWAAQGQRLQEEALLPGSIRQLGNGTPHLDHMVLSGALTESMIVATVARVVAHTAVV